MNYEEAMNFIQNTNKFGSVLGLDNIRELLERLGNPQDQLRVVHIAGTNGKGSTLAFLAGIFAGAGYSLESNREHGEGRSDPCHRRECQTALQALRKVRIVYERISGKSQEHH